MKDFNIENIENSLQQLTEISDAVKFELIKKQSYYARLCGIDRQMVNAFVKGRSNFKTKSLLHIYKTIRADLNKQ